MRKNANKSVKETENVWKGLDDVIIGEITCGSVKGNGKCENPTFNPDQTSAGPNYANWGSNQPDNMPTVQPDSANYVRITPSGEWYDVPKTNNELVICIKKELITS